MVRPVVCNDNIVNIRISHSHVACQLTMDHKTLMSRASRFLGYMYTGTHDGKVMRISEDGGKMEVIARLGQNPENAPCGM